MVEIWYDCGSERSSTIRVIGGLLKNNPDRISLSAPRSTFRARKLDDGSVPGRSEERDEGGAERSSTIRVIGGLLKNNPDRISLSAPRSTFRARKLDDGSVPG